MVDLSCQPLPFKQLRRAYPLIIADLDCGKAALRQDPNVIVIGEMRDYESIQIALTGSSRPRTGTFSQGSSENELCREQYRLEFGPDDLLQ